MIVMTELNEESHQVVLTRATNISSEILTHSDYHWWMMDSNGWK